MRRIPPDKDIRQSFFSHETTFKDYFFKSQKFLNASDVRICKDHTDCLYGKFSLRLLNEDPLWRKAVTIRQLVLSRSVLGEDLQPYSNSFHFTFVDRFMPSHPSKDSAPVPGDQEDSRDTTGSVPPPPLPPPLSGEDSVPQAPQAKRALHFDDAMELRSTTKRKTDAPALLDRKSSKRRFVFRPSLLLIVD